MKDYKESLIDALDIVKDSKRCLGCVGSCNECEYFLAIEKIENAIERLGELVENKPLEFEELKEGEGMNKYEEALKKLVKASCPEKVYCEKCDCSRICNKEAREWIDSLRELVGKETPKMPDDIPSGHIPKHGKCPNCGSFVVLTCSNDRCRVCGQMLKWEEEE